MASKKPFVVACINEEKTMATVVLKVLRYIDKVIVCGDTSKDMTTEIAEKPGAETIKHIKNIALSCC